MKQDLSPNGEKKYTIITLAVFLIYCAIILWGINIHEPWRDEAQAWLLVRDLNIVDLLKTLRVEGHPPLWYFIIMPVAKLGLPYTVQNYIAGLILCTSVFILLYKTKLPIFIKLILPFSFFFLYEYSLFARSYCLIAFFTTALISLYPKRFDNVWLYLFCIVGLFNTHVLCFTFSFALLIIFSWELYQRKLLKEQINLIALVICFLGGAYLIPYLYFAPVPEGLNRGLEFSFERLQVILDGGLAVSQNKGLAILLLLAIIASIYKSKKALIVLMLGALGVLYILGMKYSPADTRHFGVIFFIVVMSASVANDVDEEKWQYKNIAFSYFILFVICFIQLKPALERFREDNNRVYSGAKEAAEYLVDSDLTDKVIVGHQSWAASAILPYLNSDKKIFYGECERYGSYYIYDSCFSNNKWAYPVDHSIDVAYKNFKEDLGNVVLVFNHQINQKAERFLDLIYVTSEQPIRSDEKFYMYKFKDGVK